MRVAGKEKIEPSPDCPDYPGSLAGRQGTGHGGFSHCKHFTKVKSTLGITRALFQNMAAGIFSCHKGSLLSFPLHLAPQVLLATRMLPAGLLRAALLSARPPIKAEDGQKAILPRARHHRLAIRD